MPPAAPNSTGYQGSYFSFRDRDGKKITFNEWKTMSRHAAYRTIKITYINSNLIVTEWIGVGDANLNFQVRRFHLPTETEDLICLTETEAQAMTQHEKFVKELSKKGNSNLPTNMREVCILCGSQMNLKQGRFGPFYSCSSWPKTECPCIINKNGKPNAKTRNILAQMGESSVISKNNDPEDVLEDRFNNLELD